MALRNGCHFSYLIFFSYSTIGPDCGVTHVLRNTLPRESRGKSQAKLRDMDIREQ